MEKHIRDFIKSCNNNDYKRAPEGDFDTSEGKVLAYKLESEDGDVLTYWNSSNLQSIRHEAFLKNLVDDLLEESCGGTCYDGWNEIMYEIR